MFACETQTGRVSHCSLFQLAQKIAVIKLRCTLQRELLDVELRRCSPRHPHNHKSSCTAAGQCVVTVEFRHLQMYTVMRQIYSCVLCLMSFLSASAIGPPLLSQTSSWLQEELPSEQERQKDQQVHVRVQEEWNLWHGRRAHLRGGHLVPQANWVQAQAGRLSGWVEEI